MHLLVILLQQLLGVLKGKQPAPQAEIVRPRQPEARGPESNAFARIDWGTESWMTMVPTVIGGGRCRYGGKRHRERRRLSDTGERPPIEG
jgi:hypothetical protein